MTSEKIILFLTALRVSQVKVGGLWVSGCCPLAQWLHKKGHDSKPSFGISISDTDRSSYNCFSCGGGSLEHLIQVMEMYTKGSAFYDFALCHKILDEDDFFTELPEYSEVKHKVQVFQEWPAYWIDSFPEVSESSKALDYLSARDVTPAVAEQYGLRYDINRRMIMFPYHNAYDKPAGARGRSILSDTSFKHFDYSFQGSNNARIVWYNEQVLNLNGAVVVVEGQFDCIRTQAAYPKTIANLTARPSWEKMTKLTDCDAVIQIPDNDDAGEMSIKAYAEMCKKLHLVHKVCRLGAGVKDPAECAVDYLRERINSFL